MAQPTGDPPANQPDRPRPPPSPPADGRFRLGLRLGEATIAVDPPAPGGRPVELAEVRAALRAWPLDALDEPALERATREGTGQPVAVGRIAVAPTPGARAPFALKIAADRRAAYLLPWASCPAEIADPAPVEALLRVAGVRHGVDRAALGALLGRPLERPVLLARATPPGPCADGALEPLVELLPFDPRAPEPEAYPAVRPGDPLLRRVPPAAGRAGVDVTGQPLAGPPGEAASLVELVGPGTALAPGGDAVVAAASGRAMFRDVPGAGPPGGTASRVVVVADAALRREARRSADGYFELRCERGQVRLVVDAPAAGGQPVRTQDVYRALAGWPLGRADVAVIDAAVAAADSLPSLVGEIVPAGEPAPTDPYALTHLPERGLVYLVPWAAHRAPPLDAAAARASLARAGLAYGLDEEALGRLAAGPWSRPTAVARLGERRYRARTVAEAIRRAMGETGLAAERLEATVERTERGGWLGRGGPWLEVVVRPTPAAPPARAAEPGRLESRCAAGERQVRAVAPRDLPPPSHDLIEATARRWGVIAFGRALVRYLGRVRHRGEPSAGGGANWAPYAIAFGLLAVVVLPLLAGQPGPTTTGQTAGTAAPTVPSLATSTAPAAVTSPTRDRLGTLANPFPLGSDVIVGEVKWKILYVDTPPGLSQPSQPPKRPQGEYLVVVAQVENIGRQAKAVTNLRLVDGQGRQYTAVTDTLEVEPPQVGPRQNINPNMFYQYSTVFDLPADAAGLAVSVSDLSATAPQLAYVSLGQ